MILLYVLIFLRGTEPSASAVLFPDKASCQHEVATLHNVPKDWRAVCIPVHNKAEAAK